MPDAPAPPAQAAPPAFLPTQEVRFAVVMYGGVSLAIYINGVAQELLSLVRATAPAGPVDAVALHTDAELEGTTAAVYRELGRILRYGERPEPDASAPSGPIATRFVVDVISGTSAGGINGVYLAKALAGNRTIDALKELWVDEGDIAKLIDDDRSYADLEGLEPVRPPRAALNGRRMYWKLLEALDRMDPDDAPAGGDSPLVDELDLWVTTTDLRGITVPLDLYDRTVFELRHRKVFRFLYRGSLSAGDAEIENQFLREHNPMLAFAARCTSAFPFAFEPVQLADVDAVLAAGFSGRYGPRTPGDKRWQALFADTPAPEDALLRSFADGGYLDNKPFSWATASLALRSANRPVDRRLIYIEPDPSSPRVAPHLPGAPGDAGGWGPLSHLAHGAAAARPDALQNVQAALVGIPRYEPIREDLEQLVERNREVDRLQEIVSVLDAVTSDDVPSGEAAGGEGTAARPEVLDVDAWRRRPVVAVTPGRGLQYVAYQRLRVAATGDDVAALLTRTTGFDERSDEQSAIRCLVQAWLDRHFEGQGEGERSQNEFLARYDFAYRVRRLDFLQRRADQAIRAGEDTEALLRFKTQLSQNLAALRAAGRALRARADLALPLERGLLLELLSGARDKAESVHRATDRLVREPDLEKSITARMRGVHEALEPAFDATRDDLVEALGSLPATDACRRLRRVYDFYELYDSVHYPIAYRSVGEADRVEVIRVSPLDATSLVSDPAAQRRKLAGSAIHHFGGFFDAAWRRNDILWGRLDAAERILTSFLPPGETRDRLLVQAQHAIVREEVLGPHRDELTAGIVATRLAGRQATEEEKQALATALAKAVSPEQVLKAIADVPDERRLDPAAGLDTAARMAAVTGQVLEALSVAPQAQAAGRWTARLGHVAVRFVDMAVGRSVTALLTRWWAQVLVVAAVVMILGGALVGLPEAASAGWILLLVLAAAKLARWALGDVIRREPGGRGRRLAAVAGGLVVVVCVAWAAVSLARAVSDGVNDAACDLPDPLERITQDAWPLGDRTC